jgi:hypothetical protein
MFNQLSMWQMVVDLGLVTAVLIMAFKAMKSSRSHALIPQIVDIETRVQKLIAEVEGSAKHLNDQLLRREQNIHKYVGDLERREKEISLSVTEGESLAKELALLCESARQEVNDLQAGLSEISKQREEFVPSRERASSRYTLNNMRDSEYNEEMDRRADSVEQEKSFSTRSSSRRASDWLEDSKPLRVESEEDAPRQSPVQALQALYDTAETMLKRGQKPREVSQKTKLPFDRVERLAQMIEIEREERAERTRMGGAPVERDSRLGALGATRRSSSSL